MVDSAMPQIGAAIILKNGQTYLKKFPVFTPQNFKSMFGHFLTSSMKELKCMLIDQGFFCF